MGLHPNHDITFLILRWWLITHCSFVAHGNKGHGPGSSALSAALLMM